jgi:hypothetical protein
MERVSSGLHSVNLEKVKKGPRLGSGNDVVMMAMW